ncbi:DUF3560 domain-containing protein [Planobispora takensis]|uniref:DUF3560 domain-containing protein n=1 Tax=Planobispora takensis TaxID=1367882 RepID=A0A8J3SVN9_9ACTN|nr:DUF3560 domain-containing protein [Planobispora takensis]GIH99174.1 hypothetical protein Pta02_11830 [Planobispora takensis]
MGIVITHTRAEGTIVEGTRKGDGAKPILRRHGFRWSGYVGAWIIYHSQDGQAQTWKINPCAEELRAAGFSVEVVIDEDKRRTFAEAEAGRYERAEDRAGRFADRADHAADRSEAAWQGVKRIADGIPFGQPIMISHHSEARARRDQERIDRGMRRSVEEGRKAGYWTGRAEAAENYRRHRENVPTTLRRIERLEADKRVYERALAGDSTHGWDALGSPDQAEEIRRRVAEMDEELAYWRELVAQAEADGVKIWSACDFRKGDFVRYGGTWFEVVRVNKKSLTVPAFIAGAGHRVLRAADSPYSWTDRLPYDKVTGRRSAEEIQAGQRESEADR